MTDERTDEIARHAASLIQTGRATDIAEAIRAAADALKLGDAPRPGHGLVRKHAQAMAMQAVGEPAYTESIREVWRCAEQIMTIIENAVTDAATLLVGRAARGHIDAGVNLHIRIYTCRAMRDIVEILTDHGYEEPRFETADTRFGRLDRIRFEDEGREVVITRCLPEMLRDKGVDLFNRRRIATVTAEELRGRLSNGE